MSHGTKTISINNSCIVTQELKSGLISHGFTVINSYLNEFEFEAKESRIHDYWDLPYLLDKNLAPSLDVTRKLGLDQPGPASGKIRDYIAVLGVNTISVDGTTIVFLQHFSNIHKDLMQAKKVFLVIG